ncbi:DNRLRE domain-containing protein [Candidatus Galacturonibacter soehngenii]|uniref:DNRLRE domain-containing protein n=1 Tax=Candidatus Galacturonatibacter soehngenii TaxID=2307010 RepID=A0A7V7UBG3_9FIRM|nr:DNRLRE domain-containing protein [Candidatus Galacturonibacter soehngenii]KAB1438078.1 DNRLRE domain-containing protein [Candidatus Galacturonibacter soehngenii]
MKKYKKIVACLLTVCLFSTNSLTSFAQIVEDVRSEKESKGSEKEIFEYPNANIYSETDESVIQIEDSQSNINIPEEDSASESPTSDSQDTDDNQKENTENDADKPTIEQPIIEETDQESKEDNSDEKDKLPKTDENKDEGQEETSKKTEDDKEVIDEKKENQSEEQKEDLMYPILDEEVDEFEQLYGSPIEVTQYTKVYKTAEGAYKTVYSEIPNTYIDENGQEIEIDNTLEPIIEEKEIETVIDKEDTKEEDIKENKKNNDISMLIQEKILSNQRIIKDEENTTIKDESIQTETEEEEVIKEIKEVVTAYKNSSNNMEVILPGEASESNGITLNKDDFSITLQPVEGDYSKVAVKENAILYNQVYENIDIQYTVDTFGVKEDIILNEKTDKNIYTYELSKKGLSARLIDNVVYLFKEGENIPSMLLSAPLMKDEAGAESKNITLSLEEKEGNYIVSMEADETWLNSDERVYPIHIDPSIDTIDKDIVIYSICSGSNFLSSTTGYVGYDEVYGKSRSYVIIGYPFTAMLPDNAVITNATLNLYQYAGNEKGKITCYRLEEALPHEAGIDGMTWKDTVSINREMAGEKSSFNSKKGKHEIDIRDTVSRWVEGIAPVHGLVLIANNETKTNAEFYTYESSGISKSKKPKIVIDWKYEGELDENAYSLNDTTINLRTLIEANINGKHFFHGVYADGEAKPGATVKYELNDTSKSFNSSVLAGFFKVFPDSSATNSLFPSGTTKYKDKLSNWQTMLPFVDYDFNV